MNCGRNSRWAPGRSTSSRAARHHHRCEGSVEQYGRCGGSSFKFSFLYVSSSVECAASDMALAGSVRAGVLRDQLPVLPVPVYIHKVSRLPCTSCRPTGCVAVLIVPINHLSIAVNCAGGVHLGESVERNRDVMKNLQNAAW